MTQSRDRLSVILLVTSLVTSPLAVGGRTHAATRARPINGAVPIPQQKFTDAELDELLAPIALYPNPLLAQVAPASTFIDQLEDAQSVLRGKSDDNLIANQSWDVSVNYHGWVGGGWVGVNRTFVNVNRNVYVNNRYNRVNVNRSITNRNISSYRNTLNRSATVRRDRVNNANPRNRANINIGNRTNTDIRNRPNVNTNDRVNRTIGND
jgi:hypothetical protein